MLNQKINPETSPVNAKIKGQICEIRGQVVIYRPYPHTHSKLP